MKLIILIIAASILVSATPTRIADDEGVARVICNTRVNVMCSSPRMIYKTLSRTARDLIDYLKLRKIQNQILSYNPTQIPYRNWYKNLHDVTNFKVGIINGHEAVPHSIPYQAFLETHTKDSVWHCGGSLISRNYVLTSADCVYGESAVVYVTLGMHDILKNENTQLKLVVNSFTIHPNFVKGKLDYNLALMKLPETVPDTSAIHPVKLPKRSDATNTYVGSIARISGWGYFSVGVSEISNVLRYADVEVMTSGECVSSFGFWASTERVVCTSGKSNTGACYSDGGDPLIFDGVQIGVSTFIIEDCPLGSDSGYARITAFLDWIEQNSDVYIE